MRVTVGPAEFFNKAKSESRNKGDVKRPMSERQLKSACTVFGNQISPKCKNVSASNLGSALKQELEPVVEESQETIAKVLDEIDKALLSLDERVARLESDGINEEDEKWRSRSNGHHQQNVTISEFFKRGAQ